MTDPTTPPPPATISPGYDPKTEGPDPFPRRPLIDNDRERIKSKARSIVAALADLEVLALTAATRHAYQVGELVKEVAELKVERDAAVAEAWRLVAVETRANDLQQRLDEVTRQRDAADAKTDKPLWAAAKSTLVTWTTPRPGPRVGEAVVVVEETGDPGPWVIGRNDANGRRWWTPNDGWVKPLPAAHQFSVHAEAQLHKPRGSKIVSIVEAQALADNDRRIAAAAIPPPAPFPGGVAPENYIDGGIVDDAGPADV